jgi:hypothetical protein
MLEEMKTIGTGSLLAKYFGVYSLINQAFHGQTCNGDVTPRSHILHSLYDS